MQTFIDAAEPDTLCLEVKRLTVLVYVDVQQSMGEAVRPDFPLLHRTVQGGKPLIYLDSGATSQKPRVVLDALADYYAHTNSHVVAPVHALSAESCILFRGAREKVHITL